jgi:RNA polymerase sigma factor (sigma-70 family)
MHSQTAKPHRDAEARDPRSDGVLLQQFARHRDQEAFARLLARHGPYLLGVCRRVTAHAQDAEDVFQAAFLELVRKAAAISRADSVAGWLQTVAVRLGRKARARRVRLSLKEVSGMIDQGTVTADDASWREVRQVLDEEIARLPDELRAPIIVCLFEGRTQEEAGEYLEMNPRTLKARVARGRELLRKRLTRRGVTLAVLGAVLSGSSAQAAVSATLKQATVQGATAIVSKTALAGVVSPTVLSLTGSTSLLAGWGMIAAVLAGVALSAGTLYVARDRLLPRSARPTVTCSFRGGAFDSDFLEWAGTNAERYARLEEQGLRITLPSENGPPFPIGVKVRPVVRGDFELEATFEFLDVPRPAAGSGGGVTVYFFMDDDEWHGVWFGKMIDGQRGPVFVLGHRLGKREERVTKFADAVEAGGEQGIVRVRVVREGAAFSLFAAEGETGEFQHIQTLKISPEDLRIVRFATDWGFNPNVAMDVRLLDFSMTADAFVGYDIEDELTRFSTDREPR